MSDTSDQKLDALIEAVGCLVQEQRATRGSINRLISALEGEKQDRHEAHTRLGALVVEHEGRLDRHEGRLDRLEQGGLDA
jgi:hypothetical protein